MPGSTAAGLDQEQSPDEDHLLQLTTVLLLSVIVVLVYSIPSFQPTAYTGKDLLPPSSWPPPPGTPAQGQAHNSWPPTPSAILPVCEAPGSQLATR